MTRIAKNEIYFGQDISPEEIASRIDATTNDEIVALAEALLREEQLALTLLGDLKGNALPDIATASA
jgi:predicted Zn-dependent peptidase